MDCAGEYLGYGPSKQSHGSKCTAVAGSTWAQGGARTFLHILALTEGPPVEWHWVGAASAPLLPAPSTAGAAG